MRKTLIFGSLLAVLLMMMLPTVSAAEAKITQTAKPSSYSPSISGIDIVTFREKYKGDPSPQTIILLTLAILFLKLLRWGSILFLGGILLIILLILGRSHNTTGVVC